MTNVASAWTSYQITMTQTTPKAAEKECKVISSDKDVQKACKKVVKDVLKKNKDPLAMCKLCP